MADESNKPQDNEDKDDFCDKSTTLALLGIQKDNLVAMGKLLIKMETMIEKLDDIEDEVTNKDHTKSFLRFIGFLILTICALAGIQVGQLTGIWDKLFLFLGG